MQSIELKLGSSKVSFDIDEANLYGILNPEDMPGVNDGYKEVKNALENPIGSTGLKEMAQGKKNIVILASDITRPSPSHILIPPIVEELLKAGLNYDNITVVFGLGYHRKHTEEEKKKLLGEELYSKVKRLDHDIDDCI